MRDHLDTDEYFALAPPEDIGKKLNALVERDGNVDKSGPMSSMRDLWTRAYLYYFGRSPNGLNHTSRMGRGGAVGELATIRVNHARSLVNSLQTLILADRVTWKAISTNSDYASEAQTVLGRNVLEYYWRQQLVEQYTQRCLEEAIVTGETFLFRPWDETLGDPVAPTDSGLQRSGDLKFIPVSCWDVIRDPYKRSYSDLDWVIVHVRQNKWELCARYPDMADKIKSAGSDRMYRAQDSSAARLERGDDISVYYFFHKRGGVLPEGRETVFVSDECVLKDGRLTYENIPLDRVYAGEIFNTPFAYTPFFEVLGLQELIDSLETTIATNQTTFGVQMVAAPAGTNFSPESFGGVQLITYPAGTAKPEALQLTKSPPEVFSHLETKKHDMEQLFGLNSVVRGEARSGEQSGKALALLSAQAKQQSSVLQGSYLRFLMSVGEGIIQTIRRKCPYPRRVAIAGKANAAIARWEEYDPQSQLSSIDRVQVDIGNPMEQTVAGRQEIANTLIQGLGPGRLTGEQILQVIETGKLEPLTQALQSELLLIKYENEQITSGNAQLPALIDDDHVLHMREHRAEVANPDARGNPQAMAAYAAHMDLHWQLYTSADPARLLVFGMQPPPQIAPPPGAPAPAGPGGPPPPPGNGPPPPPPGGPGAPPANPSPAGNLPTVPNNPLNGESLGLPPPVSPSVAK